MFAKKGLGLGLTKKAVPTRSSEDQNDRNSPAFSQPADGSTHENEIHGPGKGAHTEESEVRPHHTPGAEKPRRN